MKHNADSPFVTKWVKIAIFPFIWMFGTKKICYLIQNSLQIIIDAKMSDTTLSADRDKLPSSKEIFASILT